MSWVYLGWGENTRVTVSQDRTVGRERCQQANPLKASPSPTPWGTRLVNASKPSPRKPCLLTSTEMQVLYRAFCLTLWK